MKEFQPVEELEWEEFDEEVVIINLKTGLYYRFNKTGSFIWKLLCEGKDKDQIIQQMIEKYEVKRGNAIQDFEEFISHLKNEKLITG